MLLESFTSLIIICGIQQITTLCNVHASTGILRAAYLDVVRKSEGVPLVCESCRADALTSVAMPVGDSTHITGDSVTLPSMDASTIASALTVENNENATTDSTDEQHSDLIVSECYDVFQ